MKRALMASLALLIVAGAGNALGKELSCVEFQRGYAMADETVLRSMQCGLNNGGSEIGEGSGSIDYIVSVWMQRVEGGASGVR